MDKQKTNLLDAYVRKAIALGKINMIESKQSEIDSNVKITPVTEDIDAIFIEVGKFIEYTDQKVMSSISLLFAENVINVIRYFIGHYLVIVARFL